MTHEREQRTQELLRAWGAGALPVEHRSQDDRQRRIAAVQTLIAGEGVRRLRLRSYARRAAMGVAAAAAMAVGFGAFRLGVDSGERSAVVSEAAELAIGASEGGVVLQRGGAASVLEARANGRVLVGDQLETLFDGRAELTTRHSKYEVAPSTRIELVDADLSGERLRLAHGRVDVDVEPSKDRSVIVVTPDAEVVVVGTVFSVQVEGQGGARETTVIVERGTVRVMQDSAQRAVLHGGEQWSSRSGDAATPHVNEEPAPQAKLPGAPAAGSSSSAGTLAEENRLFRAALDARNKGNHAQAANLFAELLRRFPRSVVGEEASLGRLRVLQRAGRAREAASEARRYLARFPAGHGREEALRVLSGTVHTD